MNKNIKNWISKNIEGHEITPATNGNEIIFIPVNYAEKAKKYFKRYNIKWEYRANYTWIAFFIPQTN